MVQSRLASPTGTSICILAGSLIILSGCESPRVVIKPGPVNPKTATDYVKSANYYSNQGNRNGAITSYTQAIALEPDVQLRCDYIVNRGVLRHNEYRHSIDPNAEQDIAGAEKDFNEAVRLCPESAQARWVGGIFYTNTGHPEKGIEDYNFLIALEPSNTFYWSMRSAAYAVLGDLERALADADKAITLSRGEPSTSYYWQRRAWACFKCGDISGSLQDLDKSISLAKGINKCPSLLMKGAVLEEQGQVTAAIATYEQCIKETEKVVAGEAATAVAVALPGAANIASNLGKAALMSPAGIFGMGVGFTSYALLTSGSPTAGLAKIYRDNAKQQIARIKSDKTHLR